MIKKETTPSPQDNTMEKNKSSTKNLNKNIQVYNKSLDINIQDFEVENHDTFLPIEEVNQTNRDKTK